jgi:hypothetical protein
MAPLKFPKGSPGWCYANTNWGNGPLHRPEPVDPYAEHNNAVLRAREEFQEEIRQAEIAEERSWARSKLQEELNWAAQARGTRSSAYKEIVAQIRAFDGKQQ